MAGRSLRCARSPVAPKMTIVVGWTGSRSRPSTSGVSSRSPAAGLICSSTVDMRASALLVQDRVPAELVAERRVHLGGVRLVLSRREALHKRQRDHRGRYRLVDRLEDRPAALAGVLHEAADVGEVVALLLERARRQLEQPRP